MTDDLTTCTGVIIGMRPMKTTGDLRVEIDIPKEMANRAFMVLGGCPDPGTARHVRLEMIYLEGTS